VDAIAVRVNIDPRHLRRVLAGERPGSVALLDSVSDLAEEMPGHTPQEKEASLINAAVHMFFLKRGGFDSEICRAAPIRRTKS
jgi:hypothetical protein